MQSEMEDEVHPCRLWAHSLEICRAKQRKCDSLHNTSYRGDCPGVPVPSDYQAERCYVHPCNIFRLRFIPVVQVLCTPQALCNVNQSGRWGSWNIHF